RLDHQGLTKGQAAAKAGLDDKTARKYRRLGRLPSEVRMPHTWRTRPNPFAEVWPRVEEQLTLNPGLEAKTVFEWLQREYPGRFADGQLRTLQRHIKQWRALHGPAKEVFFSQVHQPGHLCASDFTHASSLQVTIDGQPFPHLIYHFVLTYSNWEAGTVCFAESFESLSDGLQNALAELGGVPQVHRTDALTAAVPPGSDRPAFQRRYQALLRHYGLRGQSINPTHSHENGDVEQSHWQFKRALDQALMLRGSRDFASRPAYEAFLRQLFAQRNQGRRARLVEELALLRPLPGQRLDACQRVGGRGDCGSTIHVGGNTYSAASRLIGEGGRSSPTTSRCGTPSGWSSGCRGCAAGASTGSPTGTSSTGWCASRGRSPATAIATSCSRRAASAWPTTGWWSSGRNGPSGSIW